MLPFEKVDIERGERAGPAVTGAMEGWAGPAVEEEEDHGSTTDGAGASNDGRSGCANTNGTEGLWRINNRNARR